MKSHQVKSVTWGKIESEFNGLSGEMYRPREVLKKNEDIKKRVTKKYAEEKCYARRTGGGPPKQSIFTEVDTAVKEILGTRIEGRLSEFDGDAEIQYEGSKIQGDIDEHEEDCEPNEVIKLVMVNEDPSTQLDFDENHENYGTQTKKKREKTGKPCQNYAFFSKPESTLRNINNNNNTAESQNSEPVLESSKSSRQETDLESNPSTSSCSTDNEKSTPSKITSTENMNQLSKAALWPKKLRPNNIQELVERSLSKQKGYLSKR
ncbi:hypothetical protein MML48_2g00006255 [Holotrichia oblita]|uniref:Uncharacterized protein n=1 Tax=Holotrichia oblita TaxID=644536 RepID=A0ACB9TKL9_HOLOL|nr:hypothetical protein MML48_2g00006255 [Holotrichia oblita]